MRNAIRALRKSRDGAVAPTVALSLFGLIAVGGIAFDYARLAGMDTELQTAADQAALAAATQLDGGANARNRATAAANDLLRNLTLFADAQGATAGDTRRIAIPTVVFINLITKRPTRRAVAPTDANAKVVIVTAGARRASYAFTPIVGALNSGMISAQAVASLSSAICKIPPLMICAPNTNYPSATDLGKGILLKPGGGGAWVPGDYGFLDFGNGASGVKINLGKNNDAAACSNNDAGTPTEPGNKASVTKALNSRFDLYPASASNCDPSTGDYCPSENVVKDLAFTETIDVKVKSTDPVPSNPGCGAAGAKRDKGDNNVDRNGLVQGTVPKGFPRDTCHINGSCTTNFGNGTWDATAYVASNHSGTTVAAIAATMGKTAATLSRWDVYSWELADKTNRLSPLNKDVTANPFHTKIG